MAQTYSIEDTEVAVAVKPYLGGEKKSPRLLNNRLSIGEGSGRIEGVPANICGFTLQVLAFKDMILCQRDYVGGRYFGLVKSPEIASDPDLEWRQPRTMIEVRDHRGWGLYTVWTDKREPLTLRSNNNVGLWEVRADGHVMFRRIGIVCPNGRDFYVVHDVAWDGQLYEDIDREVVGVPSHPKYGSFDTRRSILAHKPFVEALPDLPTYEGTAGGLEVPLIFPSESSLVILDWWNPFMGMGRGQGIVVRHDGSSAWLCGQNIDGFDPPDKPVYLECGQRLELIAQPNGKVVVNDMGKTPRVVRARLLP